MWCSVVTRLWVTGHGIRIGTGSISNLKNSNLNRWSGQGLEFCSCSLSRRLLHSHRLAYANFGDPIEVIRKEGLHIETEKVARDEIIVKMLAAPVNPADINTIQGTYPIKPETFPAVPGNEGVGEIVKLGEGANPLNLKVGQWVIPEHPGLGTWQGYIVAKNECFIPILQIDLASAATLSVNPCTAYRMLKDYEDLKPGDTVIQNGGNSAVGQAVIQLCREFGLKSINVVRKRDNLADLKSALLLLGDENTSVITEDEVRTIGKDVTAQLALNCVGGKSATDILRVLEHGRAHVTYGGMSRQPVIIPTSQLIFNDVKLHGYWMSRWAKNNSVEARIEMYNTIGKLCQEKKFAPPVHKFVPLAKYRDALENAMKGFTDTKYILRF